MNIQSNKNISKSSETLNNDPNFSGVKQSCHRYGLNNQALQLFEHFRQSAHRQVASCNTHDMEPYSTLENGHSDVQSSTAQTSCHRYGLNNQALQLFEHFGQPAHRQIASCKAHDMKPYSTLGNGPYSDVQSPTAQTFVPYPRTHAYSSDIADAYEYKKMQLQENLTKFINHSKTMQEQSRMPSRMQTYMEWNETNHHNTTVPSVYDPRLNEF